jgi:hypothetical protein
MLLWPKPIPKPIRFHDLRTTFATHLHERTGDIQLVQEMLGHSSPTITAATYSGIRDDYAREAVNRLRFVIHRTETVVAIGTGADNARSPVLPTSPDAAQVTGITAEIGERAAGFEPVIKPNQDGPLHTL